MLGLVASGWPIEDINLNSYSEMAFHQARIAKSWFAVAPMGG